MSLSVLQFANVHMLHPHDDTLGKCGPIPQETEAEMLGAFAKASFLVNGRVGI